MTEAKVFLSALAENLPDGHQLGIWTLPGRTGRWFETPDPALSYLLQLDHDEADVDIHVGVAPPGFEKPRAEGEDLVGRHGYVADLDVSYDLAEALLARAGVPPTLLVGSGHGYHAWWLFDEPVIYEGDEGMYDRETVETIAHDWIRTLRAHARDIGITDKLDGVHDLARILRVPGTQNNKSTPCPVRLLIDDGPRYSAEEFEQHLLDPERLKQEPGAEPAAVGELLLRKDAAPPHDKFNAMMLNHELFEATWKHQRDDELPDPSPSGYDMALANIAAQASWSEQEITNLLIAHRRLHNADLKLRQDYYARTIGKAMAAQQRDEIMQGAEPQTEEAREDGLAHLCELLDLPLERIEYLDGQDPQMRFHFGAAGTVQMSAEDVRSKTVWDKRIYAVTRIPPRIPTGKGSTEQWRGVCKAFGALSVHVEVGAEASVEAETRAMVQSYILRHEVLHVPPGEPVEDDEAPFWREGRLWLRPDALRTFGRQMMDLRITRSELMQRLRPLGAESKAVYVRFPDESTTTRSFWGIPEAAVGDDRDE